MHLHFWYKCFLFSPCTHSAWFLRQLLLLNRWKPSASTENNCRVRIGGLVALFWVKLRQLALFSLKYTAKGHSLWAEKTRAAGQVCWCSHSKHQPQSSAADLAVAAGFCNIPCIVCACWSVVDAFLSRKRKKKILHPRRKISFQDTNVISSQDKLLVLLISFCGSKST